MYVHVCVSAHGSRKGGTRLPEAGVTGSCKPLDVLTTGPSFRPSEMFKVRVGSVGQWWDHGANSNITWILGHAQVDTGSDLLPRGLMVLDNPCEKGRSTSPKDPWPPN